MEEVVVVVKKPEMEEAETGMAAVVDFDMLCATVAMAGERRTKMAGEEGEVTGGGGGGVMRMWEGDVVLDCFEDRRIALESACCPWYRFGKNMRRANLGSSFLQGAVYFILIVAALASLIAFSVTLHHIYLFLGLGSVLLLGMYTGFFRTRIKKQFNIGGSNSTLDDCIVHLICPCCSLCQEARTLEMNNVQCGVWHGRGDTICLGGNGEGNKAFSALHKPSFVPIKSPEVCSMEKASNGVDHSWNADASHSEPLVPPSQSEQD